jgi:hypothetical protein
VNGRISLVTYHDSFLTALSSSEHEDFFFLRSGIICLIIIGHLDFPVFFFFLVKNNILMIILYIRLF